MTPPSVAVADAFAAGLAGDSPRAIAIYRELLRRSPDDADLHLSLGHALLSAGDFDAGWEECEWRRHPPLPVPVPRWRGAPLKGARILVRCEQGYGDSFQFVRYAAMVAARGGTVVVTARPGTKRLMASVPGVAEAIESGAALRDIAWQIPMMSLPYIFATRLETIPATVPYMTADPDLVAQWRQRLATYPGLKVGLVWSGNPDATYNARRSPGLKALQPLLDRPGVTFFALQKGAGRADLAGIALPKTVVDLDAELASFDDTAAAMMALDLVISPCTSTAHLAGALARPVWVMLATDADWRWLRERDDSPWYPTARLFRQRNAGDWGDPVARMGAELERMARSKEA